MSKVYSDLATIRMACDDVRQVALGLHQANPDRTKKSGTDLGM